MHVTQRDRPAETQGLDRAGDRTNRFVPGLDPHAAGERTIPGPAEETDEAPGDTALTPVQNPDDHLLPHVAAFREADRPVLDSAYA